MKFTIFCCKDNRFLLNITFSREKVESHVFTELERYKMLALIDHHLGQESDALKEQFGDLKETE